LTQVLGNKDQSIFLWIFFIATFFRIAFWKVKSALYVSGFLSLVFVLIYIYITYEDKLERRFFRYLVAMLIITFTGNLIPSLMPVDHFDIKVLTFVAISFVTLLYFLYIFSLYSYFREGKKNRLARLLLHKIPNISFGNPQ